MEPPLHSISIPNAVLTVLVGIILIFPAGAIAQDKTSGGGNQLHNEKELKQVDERLLSGGTGKASPTLNPVTSGVDLNSLDGDYLIFEQDQMWNRNPNPNPEWNFPLFEQGEPAGNINGDSLDVDGDGFYDNPIDDFIVTGQTNELGGTTWKTAVFFGGNSSEEPDDIVPRKLVPVGDLNDDGKADAVAVDNLDIKSVEIYEGTTIGYQGTGITIDNIDPQNFEILGFKDFNGDNRDDIFAYSETTGDVKLALGQVSFSDMQVDTYSDLLSSSPKKVFAKDIDGNNSVEIVEFYGINGDGQIQVFEFLDLTFLQKIYPFGFNPAFEDASNTDLHLIDITGNGYDEIYISLGRRSSKYVLEYDPASGDYASPIEILDGSLVPAGDLNDDGNHDFIMGNPNDNYSPHVSFGPDDLSTSLSLDVALSGNSWSDWSWEMEYNSYSSFGDLDGDGIDDALLSHTENPENSINYGRRIVYGSEGLNSDNSQFQLYPSEYFYSSVYELEELGDVNEDGIDDYAVIRSNEGKIEIYYGGNSISQSPDQIFNSGVTVDAVASGDFTGDGINDLAVLSWDWNYSQFEVFGGGNSFTKVKSVAFSEFIENASNLWPAGINNIGDFSGNGSDDFIIGSGIAIDDVAGEYINEAYIFYGGSTISSSPDSTIDLAGEYSNQQIFPAASAAPLGDIDGDGMGDFAVGSPTKPVGDILGEVKVFLSGSESPLSLSPDGFPFFFGWDVASGDFNGDEEIDIAVSASISNSKPPKLVHIYYGGDDFDETVDQSLSFPDFESGYGSKDSTIAELEVIPDFNNDGRDELLVGSSGVWNNHAALYSFTGIENGVEVSLVKGANAMAGLGGNNYYGIGGIASGDFTGNGEIDVVMTQHDDNNDAYQSSRVYRYALSLPLFITSIEDIPDDQGGKVRVNINGELLDLTSRYDSLVVQRKTSDNEWKTVVTDTDPGTSSYDVSVPKTQPTNNNEVDNSYTFRVAALTDTVYTSSQEIAGKAFDNISPPQVQNLSVEEQEGSKVISWQGVDISDLDSYFIYRIDDNGELSDRLLAVVEENEYTLSNSFDGVQQFVVRARDIHNNFGEPSLPVGIVYPKTVMYDFSVGWNLITLTVDDDSAKSALQDLASGPIYQYNGGYQEVEQVEEGQAYWIKFTDASNPEFRGIPLTELSVELTEGWNLIGGIGGELPVSLIDDPDEILIPETVYSLDDGKVYTNTDTLGPTQGNWIRTSAAGTITLTHPGLLKEQSEELNNNEESLAKTADKLTDLFNKITVSDGEHSAELYFGSKLPNGIDKRMFSLPPLPPGDFFDARFNDDRRLSESDKVDVQLNTVEETPLMMKVETGSAAEETQFVLKVFADGEMQAKHIVNDSEEISLRHKQIDSIALTPVGISELGQQKVPDEFDLEQNYPNPFNPTTQIQYSVAEVTDVKIDVFNILGRRIVTLVSERQEPGTYEVTFDGTNLASGIYLYRLQAGDYISTKKFILAK